MVQSSGGPPGLPPTIIDASVAAKWYLQEEEFAERALRLRAEMRAERAIVMAPDHVRYETANALRRAVRGGRITAAFGDSSITDFLTSGIAFVDAGPFVNTAYRLSLRLNTSLYDALYLAGRILRWRRHLR